MSARQEASNHIQIRYFNAPGNVNCQIQDVGGTNTNAPIAIPTNGYYCFTMVKNLTAMTFRVNGVVGATATITSTSTFSAADFMFGGGGLFTAENGVPPPVYVLARLTRAGSCACPDSGSPSADRNLPRKHILSLGKRERQHAAVELRVDLLLVDFVRKRE